jgi:uncharacterized protein (DUF302 family)
MDPLRTTVPAPLAEARPAVEAALKAQGFGILSEIDLQATFQAKLGVAHEGHRILGVCNPNFAKRALDVDRDVALLLPCTVTLREVEGGTEVRVLDPEEAFRVAAPETRAQLEPLAGEVKGLLAAAVATLRGA